MQTKIVDAQADPAIPEGKRPPVRPRGRVGWFMVVGSLAALVHWSVVVALVHRAGWQPLVANVAGWLVALGVSFAGHHQATFKGHEARIKTAAPRFLLVSAAGFLVNESAYGILLRWSRQRYDVILGAVLLGVAAFTYLLGRRWVFLGSREP